MRKADFSLVVLDSLDGPDVQIKVIYKDLKRWKIFFQKPPQDKTANFGLANMKVCGS